MNIRDAQNLSDKIVKILFQENEKGNLSNYELSKRTNLSEAALSYIKNYQRKPTLYVLLMIASASGLKLSEIIARVEKETENTSCE